MTIAPASRREVLVRGGADGDYELLTCRSCRRPTVTQPQQTLATLVSRGTGGRRAECRRAGSRPSADLRDEPVDSRHKLVYSQDPPNFYINGEQFRRPGRLDETMQLATTSRVEDREHDHLLAHVPHPHQRLPADRDQRRAACSGLNYDDNVSIPPGGSVTMRYQPDRLHRQVRLPLPRPRP